MLGCLAGGAAGYFTFLVGSLFWSKLKKGVRPCSTPMMFSQQLNSQLLQLSQRLRHADCAVHRRCHRVLQQHPLRQGAACGELCQAHGHHLPTGKAVSMLLLAQQDWLWPGS